MPGTQVSNGAPSSEQTYVTPSSLAEKLNRAVVLAVGSAGPESIVVTGGTVSRGRVTVQLWPAGVGSTWPAASVARTATRWKPIARSVYSTGDVHAVNAAPSSAHSNVEPARFEENVIVALVLSVGSAGPESIVVCGGATTVHVWLAGV